VTEKIIIRFKCKFNTINYLKKFLAIVKKEFLLLLRDWPGLLTLFVMPAILLVIITLTQESAILKEKSGIKIILVNSDSSILGDTIVNDLTRSQSFNITRFFSVREAENAVKRGTYQLAVIVQDSATEKLINLLKVSTDQKEHTIEVASSDLAGISFIYDPAVQTIYKDAVFVPLKMVIHLSALKVLMAKYSGIVKDIENERLSNFAADFQKIDFGKTIPDFPYKNEVINKFREELANRAKPEPDLKLPANPLFRTEIVTINEKVAMDESAKFKPNPLQNNVPAFTLFAMFFIVIPLAGSILNEKHLGVYARLRTLPVSYSEIISAKIAVFLSVCILQFILLMAIGVYIMPMLGDLPPLDLRVSYPALALALIASGLAATGFGIIVGTLAGTHGQAATFGSVMVVILAMLGGIFVPVHMLPETIKKISMISPLRWGTDAFLGVFARNEGIGRIWPELFLLIGFFCISLILSVRIFNSRK
jgi:ABC-2 type transport system permease protein